MRVGVKGNKKYRQEVQTTLLRSFARKEYSKWKRAAK